MRSSDPAPGDEPPLAPIVSRSGSARAHGLTVPRPWQQIRRWPSLAAAVGVGVLSVFFGLGAVQGAASRDVEFTAAATLAALSFGILACWVLRHRYRSRTGAEVVLDSAGGASRTIVRQVRGSLLLVASWAAVSGAGLVWITIETAASGVWLLAVLSGGACLLLVVPLLGSLRRLGAPRAVELDASGVRVASSGAESRVVAWDDVSSLQASLRTDSGIARRTIVITSRAEPSPAPAVRSTAIGPLRAGQPPGPVELSCEDLDLEPVLLFHLLRFYLENPTVRRELGTAASASRVRRRDLPGG